MGLSVIETHSTFQIGFNTEVNLELIQPAVDLSPPRSQELNDQRIDNFIHDEDCPSVLKIIEESKHDVGTAPS